MTRDFENEMLETVSVTRGRNGCPKNVYRAVVFNRQDEVQAFADWSRNTPMLLRRRDGWFLWEKVRDIELPYTDPYDETCLPDDDETSWHDDVWSYQIAIGDID